MSENKISFTEKYRPRKIDDMLLAQTTFESLHALMGVVDTVNVIMLVGPTGYGKTTAARIIAHKLLGDKANTELSIKEINAADERGIDDVRQLAEFIKTPSLFGVKNIVILNEAQQLTDAAQNCLLAPMEGNPNSCFILTTTEPRKIINTIKSRAYTVTFDFLNQNSETDITRIVSFLAKIVHEEKHTKLDFDLLQFLAKSEPNSIRKFLQKLELLMANNVTSLGLRATSLISGTSDEITTSAIKVARLISERQFVIEGNKKYTEWAKIATEIQLLNSDVEGARRVISGYIRSIILGTKSVPSSSRERDLFFRRARMLDEFTKETEISKERLLVLVMKALFMEEFQYT